MKMSPEWNIHKKYCRSCLSIENSEMTAISLLNESANMKLLLEFLNLQVLTDNEYISKEICSTCLSKLKEAVQFKETCEKSLQYLLKLPIEQEIYDGLETIYEKFSDNSETEYEDISLKFQNKEKEFKCSTCPKTFSRKTLLTQHISTHESNFKCEHCGKIFKKQGFLEKHEQCHRNDPKSQCKVCGKSVNDLSEHMKRHSTEQVTCKYCGNIYKTKYYLQNHVMDIHLEPDSSHRELCAFCGRTFRFKSDLNVHIRFKHTDERTVHCDQCDMKFKTKSYLRRHERNVHLNKRSFKCNYCTKGFNSKEGFVKHLRCHTGEKAFKCKICDSAFTHSAILYRHTKSVHGKPV